MFQLGPQLLKPALSPRDLSQEPQKLKLSDTSYVDKTHKKWAGELLKFSFVPFLKTLFTHHLKYPTLVQEFSKITEKGSKTTPTLQAESLYYIV